MIDEQDLVLCSRSEGDAYKSSHSGELNLNAAILRADISKSSIALLYLRLGHFS